MFVLFASCCSILTPAFNQAGTSEIASMVARKLEMAGSYHVRLRVEMKNHNAIVVDSVSYTAELWRAGDKLRFDITDAAADPPPANGLVQPGSRGAREVTCQNCERQGYVIITNVYPGKPIITSLVEFNTSPSLSGKYDALNIDWRFLGLSVNRLSSYKSTSVTEYYRKLAINPKLRLSQRVRNEKPCLLASLGSADNEFEIYFGEPEQYNPVFYSVVNGTAQSQVKITNEVDWQPTVGGYLYPAGAKHAMTRGGKTQYEEVVTVLHADFHNRIDAAVFTLAGLGLNDNQQIAYPGVPPSDRPLWHDGKADTSLSASAVASAAGAPAEVAEPVAAYPGGDTAILYVGVASGIVAVIALTSVIVSRARRRET